jgi:uncharacterized ferritin-like protein (DUF455 family)
MFRAEEYRKHAAELIRVAQENHNPNDRAVAVWRELARKLEAEEIESAQGIQGTPQRPHFIARSAIGRRSRTSVLGIAVLVKAREDDELQSE